MKVWIVQPFSRKHHFVKHSRKNTYNSNGKMDQEWTMVFSYIKWVSGGLYHDRRRRRHRVDGFRSVGEPNIFFFGFGWCYVTLEMCMKKIHEWMKHFVFSKIVCNYLKGLSAWMWPQIAWFFVLKAWRMRLGIWYLVQSRKFPRSSQMDSFLAIVKGKATSETSGQPPRIPKLLESYTPRPTPQDSPGFYQDYD